MGEGICQTSYRVRVWQKPVLWWGLRTKRDSGAAGWKILDPVGIPLIGHLGDQVPLKRWWSFSGDWVTASFLLIIIRSGLQAEIRWSVCISKSHRSLCVSFSRTGAGLCIYHLLAWSNLNFLHISQWITLNITIIIIIIIIITY